MNSLYQSNDLYTFHHFKDREEWLSYRIKGIGGSDASATVGMNPYKSNQDLWKEKLGLKSNEVSSNKAMAYGNNAEGLLRELFKLDFEDKYEVQYVDNTIVQNKSNPFLLYSPDGLLLEYETGKKGIYEGKTTEILSSMHRESWKEKIPQNYYIQVLHGLLTLEDYDFVILKAQLKMYNERNGMYLVTNHYRIDRENVKEDLAYLLENEKVFYEHIVNKTEPSLMLSL